MIPASGVVYVEPTTHLTRRLVRFQKDDGSYHYYGTYTAYNGQRNMPLLMRISKSGISKVVTLMGRCVQNKGLALFPRRVGSKYAMIGRLDGENLFFRRSDQVSLGRFWG